MKVDYLIVGQGIAGSVLALTLDMQGKSVTIINDPALSASSRIAAGVYNPFNFRKSIPTWRAHDAIDAAKEFYPAAERLTESKFHEQKEIIRIFSDEKEQQDWNAYLQQQPHRFATELRSDYNGKIAFPFGGGIVQEGGVVRTDQFMEVTRRYFSNRGYYLAEKFNYERLNAAPEEVSYDNRITARFIVFCEGHLAAQNPFFRSNSVAPSKGELLHVRIPGLQLDEIVNGPVYLAPLGNDLYVCGATFNPLRNDEELTSVAQEELLQKLRNMINLPVEVVHHFAGVRPAGRDRKAVIGTGKQNRNVAIFNGMGSKGVMQAPLLAQMLVNHLENGVTLPREIDIQRFRDAL